MHTYCDYMTACKFSTSIGSGLPTFYVHPLAIDVMFVLSAPASPGTEAMTNWRFEDIWGTWTST